MARKKKKAGNSLNVDFTGVDSGPVLHPEGPYSLEITSAEHKENDADGRLNIKCEILEGPSKKLTGKSALVSLNLGESSLWVLRSLLEAIGMEIPDGPADIDLDDLVGQKFTAVNTHNEYNGNTRNQFGSFGTADGEEGDDEEDDTEVEDDEDDEDEAPKGKKKAKKERKAKKGKKSKVEDDEDEEEDAEDEDDSDDEDEEDEDEAPKGKKGKKDKKSKKSKKDDDDEDEEESDNPTEDEVGEMSEKELKALIKKHKLDVDLDDHASLRKKRLAVTVALEEEGLLSE